MSYKNNKFKMIASISVLTMLQACSTTPLTPEQEEAANISTLNIYPDNRVLIRDDGDWKWSEEKSIVIGLAIHHRIYNAKDINKISTEKNPKGNEIWAIYLKDGTKLSGSKNIPTGSYPNWDKPAWVICDLKKKCGQSKIYLNNSSYPNNFGNIFFGIKDEYLNNRDTVTYFNSSWDYQKSTDVISNNPPTGRTIEIVENISIEAFKVKLAASLEKRDKYYEKISAEMRKKNENEEQERTAAINKANQLKKITCSSISYSCRQPYSDATRIRCDGFESSIETMKSNGWSIDMVTSEFHRRNIGELCDYNIYHFRLIRR